MYNSITHESDALVASENKVLGFQVSQGTKNFLAAAGVILLAVAAIRFLFGFDVFSFISRFFAKKDDLKKEHE